MNKQPSRSQRDDLRGYPQTEAMRLADALEIADANISLIDDALWVKINPGTLDEAAAELRRLHEVDRKLLDALQAILNISLMDNGHWAKTIEAESRNAIAKAVGEH